MDTKLLKQKILDLAIHGKLVPQNPNDEPASKLLEKIREEKQKLIAEKKIKADKNDSYIFVGDDNRHYEKFADGTVKDIEDEIPFEVPEGWAWCRLKELALDMADGPFGSNLKTEHYTTNKEARLIQLSNIGEDGWREENTKYTTFEHAKTYISRSIVEPGNIVIAKMMPAGRAIICPNHEAMYVLSSDAVKLVPTSFINKELLLNTINSPAFRNSVTDNVQGTTRLRTSISKLRECLFPLPPKAAQLHIVEETNRVIGIINGIDEDKEDLQIAIKQAKSKILDLAIHGKLVPQDSSDEPASVLLEKLRAEKEAKIKAGELKRDKYDSFIYKNTTDNCYYEKFDGKEAVCIDDEIPFELPVSWQWSKLGRICTKLVDGDHNPPKGIEEKTDYIMASSRNINHDSIEDLENVRYLTKEVFEIENQRTQAKKGDIFFTSVGTLGRSCIYEGNLNICFQRSVSILETQIDNKYLKYFFDSTFYQDYVVEHATGTAQLGFYLQEMSESYIAISPISEQKRIASKIEEMFLLLDQIQSNLI